MNETRRTAGAMSGPRNGTRVSPAWHRVGLIRRWLPAALVLSIALGAIPAGAQPPSGTADSRAAELARAKREKSTAVHPYEPNKAEVWLDRAEDLLLSGGLHWHPFFESAYAGGGFTLGAGYRRFVSSYNTVDVRGSITFSGYKRVEAEFLAPRLFDRRGVLSVIGGWREATQVGFYGIGTPDTSSDDRANYGFKQPYCRRDARRLARRARLFVLGGGLEFSQWEQERRQRHRRRRSRRSTRPRRCPASAPRRPTCTRRARSASTRARRPATRGAAASTA